MASREYKLTKSKSPSPPPTDWEKCLVCQDDIENEALQCSAKGKNPNTGAGYSSLADNLKSFADLGILPFNIVRLDEGKGIVETFKEKSAKWHKSCALRFNKLKLQRAQKRKS